MTSNFTQLKIAKSIEQIAHVADLFPGVVLIHHVMDGSVVWISNSEKSPIMVIDVTFINDLFCFLKIKNFQL